MYIRRKIGDKRNEKKRKWVAGHLDAGIFDVRELLAKTVGVNWNERRERERERQ
jgi:hypothetical protein